MPVFEEIEFFSNLKGKSDLLKMEELLKEYRHHAGRWF